ncbi:DUF397 domain-containing protein [Streptomyces sp. NPDC020362]|uniref:DUF397 domain-containing protein n=1 Tax=unclassified Streptomyces TaxID=2593676 RepID=UPI0033DA25C2
MSAGPQPLSELEWFKSSYSGGNTTECVEAAFVASGVLLRDSKNSSGPVVVVQRPTWRRFTQALRSDPLVG